MKLVLPIILTLIIASPLFAEEPITGNFEEYAIYSLVGPQRTAYSPETTVGHSTYGNYVQIKTTDKIPLVKGLSFGFKWSAYGFPNVQKIELTHVMEHPPLNKTGGIVKRESKEKRFYKPVNGEIRHTEGYRFSEDLELTEG